MMYPKDLPSDQRELLEKVGVSYASLASTLNFAWSEGIRFDIAQQYQEYYCNHHQVAKPYIHSWAFYQIVKRVYDTMLRNRPENGGPFQMYEMRDEPLSPVIDVGKVKIRNSFTDGAWGRRLRHIRDFPKLKLIISTYSLNDLNYISAVLGNRPGGWNIFLICHRKFADEAVELKQMLPKLNIYLRPDIHVKNVLLEPNVVFIGSDNFGKGGWLNEVVEFRSKELFDYEYKMLLRYLEIDDFKAGGGDL